MLLMVKGDSCLVVIGEGILVFGFCRIEFGEMVIGIVEFVVKKVFFQVIFIDFGGNVVVVSE